MTKADLKTFRRKLLALQQRLSQDASDLADEALKSAEQASGNLSHVPIHMADLGTETFEQDFTLGLLETERQNLKEIAAALERIEEGTFGVCEECHKPISKARLNALPYTRYCVKCAEKLQESGS
jgi:DnaK suppressor protein